MFRLLAPVVLHTTTDAHPLLAGKLRPACIAAWKVIGRREMGLEFAFLPSLFEGPPLALSSRLRRDGVIVIELALDDGRHPDRIIAEPVHHQAMT